MVKRGTAVNVNVGDGERIGFIFTPVREVEDGTNKAAVQVGDKIYDNIAYRAPKDREGKSSGLTFWLFTDV